MIPLYVPLGRVQDDPCHGVHCVLQHRCLEFPVSCKCFNFAHTASFHAFSWFPSVDKWFKHWVHCCQNNTKHKVLLRFILSQAGYSGTCSFMATAHRISQIHIASESGLQEDGSFISSGKQGRCNFPLCCNQHLQSLSYSTLAYISVRTLKTSKQKKILWLHILKLHHEKQKPPQKNTQIHR